MKNNKTVLESEWTGKNQFSLMVGKVLFEEASLKLRTEKLVGENK